MGRLAWPGYTLTRPRDGRTSPTENPLTELLAAVGDGDATAQGKLWSVIYGELRCVAQHQMADEVPGHTLQSTALVHEAYFRLFGDNKVQWANRRHFFAAAAEAMRRIRVDDARRRGRLKRGGGERPSPILDGSPVFDQNLTEMLVVDEALNGLEQTDGRKAQVVKLRYFAGLTVDECAAALEVSPRTVVKDWAFARACLHRELSKGDTNAGQGVGVTPHQRPHNGARSYGQEPTSRLSLGLPSSLG